MSSKNHRVAFVHTADWQLGKPFAGIHDPLKRARIYQERFDVVRRLRDVVRRERAEFVIVTGDLLDSPSPTNATVAAALGAIASLEVPVLAIPGNHDHSGPGSLWEQPFFRSEHARLAPNFRLLLERSPVELDSAVLLPCPMTRRHEPEDPTAWIRGLDFGVLPNKPRIVLAHGSTTNFVSAGQEQRDEDEQAVDAAVVLRATVNNHIALDRLPMTELDYVALGDWHGAVQVGAKAWYSGTPEPDRFPKEGQSPGHVACVSAVRGAAPTVDLVPTGRLQWISGAVTLDTRGAYRLDEWLSASTADTGFDVALARVSITGRVSLVGRSELDAVKESWTARLLRFDVDEQVTLIPSEDEIRALAERQGDPITAGVAAELARRLASGGGVDSADVPVVREALHMLHSLVHSTTGANS